jgi:leucyl-tRNA synthetase
MKPWNPRGIEGVHRFLQKVWRELPRSGRCRVNPKLVRTAASTLRETLTALRHETVKKSARTSRASATTPRSPR